MFHYLIFFTLLVGFFSLFYKLIEAYLILNVLHSKSLDRTNILVAGIFSSILTVVITFLLRFRFMKHEIIEASAERYTWLWFWQIMDYMIGVILVYLAFNTSFF
jgi:hypothetical protein